MFVIYNDKILTSGEGICSFPTDFIPKQVDQRSVYHAFAVLRCNTQMLQMFQISCANLKWVFNVQLQFYYFNERKLKNAYQNFLALDTSVGCWALASEPWTLDARKWTSKLQNFKLSKALERMELYKSLHSWILHWYKSLVISGMKIHLRFTHLRPMFSFYSIKKYQKPKDMEKERWLEMNQYDLLFLVKHKQWEIFWQLIFLIFSEDVVEQEK